MISALISHKKCLRIWLRSYRYSTGGKKQRGFALVVVIMVMLLVSFLASQLIMLVRTELKISRNIKSRVVGHFLAAAGVNVGLFRLLDHPMETPTDLGPEEDWGNPVAQFYKGYEYEFYLPKGKVTYSVSSETGKIDLNHSQPGLIRLFLEYNLGLEAGADDERLDTITDSLLDWRDSDDMHRLNGAESEYYTTLDDPYIARNGKIQDPAEFFLIKGTDVLKGKFYASDIFTVHNTKGKINFNSMTPAMLDFVTGGNSDAVEAYNEAKKEFEGRLSASVAAEIIGDDRYALLQPYLTYSAGSNKYYFIVGTGYADVEQEGEEAPPMHEGLQAKKKEHGTVDSLLILRKGSKFVRLAWQERYRLGEQAVIPTPQTEQ